MTRVRLECSVQAGAEVKLPKAQAHHVSRVLRTKLGDQVEVIDADHRRWSARLVSVEPTRLQILAVIDGPSADTESVLEVWLPILKGGKTDDLVRQLTELGVRAIIVYGARRAVVRLQPDKLSKRLIRWSTIAAEATRQCGRLSVPEVRLEPELPMKSIGFFFWEHAKTPAAEALHGHDGRHPLRLLIGPEGGLDTIEAEYLEGIGWRAMSLGPRILRAETAVVVGATLGLAALAERGYGLQRPLDAPATMGIDHDTTEGVEANQHARDV